MLLTGTDAHLGGLGVLIEYKNGENGSQRWSGKPGYEGYLNRDVATLPEILEDNGYFTAMSGKVCLPRPHTIVLVLIQTVASWAASFSRTLGSRFSKSIFYAPGLL